MSNFQNTPSPGDSRIIADLPKLEISKYMAPYSPEILDIENDPRIHRTQLSEVDLNRIKKVIAQAGIGEDRIESAFAISNHANYNSRNIEVNLEYGSSYVLRECTGWRLKDEITVQFEADKLQYLASKGVNVPEVIHFVGHNGLSPFTTVDERMYMLTENIKPTSRFCGATLDQVAKAGEQIGKMHRAFAKSDVLRIFPKNTTGSKYNEVMNGAGYNFVVSKEFLNQTFSHVETNDDRREIFNFIKTHRDVYYKVAEILRQNEVNENLINGTDTGYNHGMPPKMLIHNDLIGSNLLVVSNNQSQSSIIYIMDFEKARIANPWYDYASAKFDLCREAARTQGLDKLDSILDAFDDTYFHAAGLSPVIDKQSRPLLYLQANLMLVRASQYPHIGLRGLKPGLDDKNYEMAAKRTAYYLQALEEALIMRERLLA